MRRGLILAFTLAFVSNAMAAGLVIHASETGVGKFHRYDTGVHPYAASNAWTPYILPANADLNAATVMNNADGSVSIFFSTLEEMLTKAVEVSQAKGRKISVLNVHGHGLPGGMWFPTDEAMKSSWACGQWVTAATGSDKANYDQYYGAVSKQDILNIRAYSQSGGSVPCVTGLDGWKSAMSTVTAFKDALAPDLHVNFLSCVVGLGPVGDEFTRGLGALLSDSDQVRLQASIKLGLGDWSMPEGMGFWDYVTDEQLNHDNSIYPVDRKDREIAQTGSVRVTALVNGAWASTLLENQSFLTFSGAIASLTRATWSTETRAPGAVRPSRVRIPGTSVYAEVKP